MWMQNNYVRTLAGISVAALIWISLSSEPTAADGSEDGKNGQATCKNCPNHCQEAQLPNTTKTHPYSRSAFNYQPLTVPQYATAANRTGYVQPASAPPRRPTPAPQFLPHSSTGLPNGDWTNETPLGNVKISTSGNKISIDIEGAGELMMFKPSLRGEFSVASDGTVYGLIHSVDLGIAKIAAQEMEEELLFLDGISDIPFSMRAYSEPGMLAIKQVTFGMPTQAMIATDGEFSELAVYAQSMLSGQYKQED